MTASDVYDRPLIVPSRENIAVNSSGVRLMFANMPGSSLEIELRKYAEVSTRIFSVMRRRLPSASVRASKVLAVRFERSMVVVVEIRPAEPSSSALSRRNGQPSVVPSAREISELRADVERLPRGEPVDTGDVVDDVHAAGLNASRKTTVRIETDTA
jgi:hypothetical protein